MPLEDAALLVANVAPLRAEEALTEQSVASVPHMTDESRGKYLFELRRRAGEEEEAVDGLVEQARAALHRRLEETGHGS
jgi:hypothetical protein